MRAGLWKCPKRHVNMVAFVPMRQGRRRSYSAMTLSLDPEMLGLQCTAAASHTKNVPAKRAVSQAASWAGFRDDFDSGCCLPKTQTVGSVTKMMVLLSNPRMLRAIYLRSSLRGRLEV